MSKATRRKHVQLELLRDDFALPTEDQQTVKVLVSRGNNLHEVQTADGTTFLVSMPAKFRRNVWVRRGTFVLVEPIPEGDKVKAEIVRVLTAEHVKWFKKDGVWPKEFDEESPKQGHNSDNALFVNTNRIQNDVDVSYSDDNETDEN